MFLHRVHVAVKPPPCHLCITRQSHKANRTHIEPLPAWYLDVIMKEIGPSTFMIM